MKMESLEEVRELGRQDFLDLKAMIERLESKIDKESALIRQEIFESRREMRQIRNWVISGIVLCAGILIAASKFGGG